MVAHDALTAQLLEWLQTAPHPYTEVLDVWRTSCPRLSIWEDACAAGLVDCPQGNAGPVALTPKGQRWLTTQNGA